MNVSTHIRQARGNTPPQTFATEVGCSVTTLWRWENGHQLPRSEAHIRSLEKYGVDRSIIDAARATDATQLAAAGQAV